MIHDAQVHVPSLSQSEEYDQTLCSDTLHALFETTNIETTYIPHLPKAHQTPHK